MNNNVNETDVSEDIESLDNESMAGNYNTASEVCLDDNISSGGVPIDPGNFSESDIDEDVSSSYAPPQNVDVFGGFPESDIEDEVEEDSMSEVGSVSLSFNSDLGSPLNSSCRSYAVSEDKEDDREEATPLPFCSSIGADELKKFSASQRRSRDCRTCNGSEKGQSNGSGKLPHCSQFKGKSVAVQASTRELRSCSSRKIMRLQSCQKKRMMTKQLRRKHKTKPKVSAAAGKRKPYKYTEIVIQPMSPE